MTATVAGDTYNVKIFISDKEETIADVYWVDLGLSFVDSAVDTDGPVRTTQFENDEADIVKRSSSVVGKTWDVGYQVVARSHMFDYTDPELVDRSSLKTASSEFMSVKNVALNYSKADDGAETTQTNSNNVSRITSTKIGSVKITGFFDTDNTDSSKVVFCFRDENGDAVQYKNVGTGTPTWESTKLALNLDWTISGKKVTVFAANNGNVHVTADSVVYVQVTDEYDNPVADAPVKYTITGVNAGTYEDASQKTDAKGLFKINLAAPGTTVTGNANSSITVTVDNNKELQESIVITYNTKADVSAFGIYEDTDTVKAVKMVDSTHMIVYFSNTVDAKSVQAGEFTLTQGGSTDNKYLVTAAVRGDDDNSVVLTLNKEITDLTASFTVKVASYTDTATGITYDLIDTYGQKLTGTTSYTFKPSERGLNQ